VADRDEVQPGQVAEGRHWKILPQLQERAKSRSVLPAGRAAGEEGEDLDDLGSSGNLLRRRVKSITLNGWGVGTVQLVGDCKGGY
jgi:hypothetical protein